VSAQRYMTAYGDAISVELDADRAAVCREAQPDWSLASKQESFAAIMGDAHAHVSMAMGMLI
jgi:hypothetical protein